MKPLTNINLSRFQIITEDGVLYIVWAEDLEQAQNKVVKWHKKKCRFSSIVRLES